MECYFAPMEGITGYVYRNAHHRFYGHIAKYFTPFLAPNQTRRFTFRESADILPEHNPGLFLVPQLLTNRAEDFVWGAARLGELGYREVNLNLGCPSGTVVSKGRGAGFLAFPEELDRFFDCVCGRMEELGLDLSVKTRIGMESAEEFPELLRIFRRYPLKELIIHPRLRTDYYRNQPDRKMFRMALESGRGHICYNGDLFSLEDVKAFREEFPEVGRIMLGRGLLADPALAERIAGMEEEGRAEPASRQAPFSEKERLRSFHDAVLAGYREQISGDKNVLFKMKELWAYLGDSFEDGSRLVKKIRKAGRMSEYIEAVDRLFEEKELAGTPRFRNEG